MDPAQTSTNSNMEPMADCPPDERAVLDQLSEHFKQINDILALVESEHNREVELPVNCDPLNERSTPLNQGVPSPGHLHSSLTSPINAHVIDDLIRDSVSVQKDDAIITPDYTNSSTSTIGSTTANKNASNVNVNSSNAIGDACPTGFLDDQESRTRRTLQTLAQLAELVDKNNYAISAINSEDVECSVRSDTDHSDNGNILNSDEVTKQFKLSKFRPSKPILIISKVKHGKELSVKQKCKNIIQIDSGLAKKRQKLTVDVAEIPAKTSKLTDINSAKCGESSGSKSEAINSSRLDSLKELSQNLQNLVYIQLGNQLVPLLLVPQILQQNKLSAQITNCKENTESSDTIEAASTGTANEIFNLEKVGSVEQLSKGDNRTDASGEKSSLGTSEPQVLQDAQPILFVPPLTVDQSSISDKLANHTSAGIIQNVTNDVIPATSDPVHSQEQSLEHINPQQNNDSSTEISNLQHSKSIAGPPTESENLTSDSSTNESLQSALITEDSCDGSEASLTINSDKNEKDEFKCQYCTSTFNRFCNFSKHLLVHNMFLSEDDVYKCKLCGRKFLQRCDLNRHLLIHNGTEPHRCEICNKAYIRKSDLVVHLRYHTKEKPFACKICTKRFAQKGDLSRHVRRVHEKMAEIRCGHCKRKYATEATLIRHMKVAHQDIIVKSLVSE